MYRTDISITFKTNGEKKLSNFSLFRMDSFKFWMVYIILEPKKPFTNLYYFQKNQKYMALYKKIKLL